MDQIQELKIRCYEKLVEFSNLQKRGQDTQQEIAELEKQIAKLELEAHAERAKEVQEAFPASPR